MGFFVDFGCALQFIFWKLMKKLLLVLGPPFRDRKSLETKQTQVKPNANKGWPIKPVNHIRPQLTRMCPNSSWTPHLIKCRWGTPTLGISTLWCLLQAQILTQRSMTSMVDYIRSGRHETESMCMLHVIAKSFSLQWTMVVCIAYNRPLRTSYEMFFFFPFECYHMWIG